MFSFIPQYPTRETCGAHGIEVGAKIFKMATKSQKEWVSPHKVSLLILIKYMSSTDEEHEEYSDCIKRCRHKLSLLLLEFFEV